MFFFSSRQTKYVIEAGLNYLQLVINMLNRNAPQEIAIFKAFLMILKKTYAITFCFPKKKNTMGIFNKILTCSQAFHWEHISYF